MSHPGKCTSEEYGYNSSFPKILRALMENRNNISPLNRSVTQAELAKHLGITRQAVSTYTLGTSVPDMLKFKLIADYFQVSYSFMLGTTNVIKDDHKNLAEIAGIRPQTQSAIVNICKTPKHAFAFMLLIETREFYDIVNSLVSYLSISKTRNYTQEELLAIDADVRERTGGALRVVPAALEKNMTIQNAQTYLAEAIRRIDKESDPTMKSNDGRIWREEDQ